MEDKTQLEVEENNNVYKENIYNDTLHVLEDICQIKEDINYLRDLFVRRLSDDKQKNAMIQKMMDGVSFAFIEPFLHDMILLLDRLEKKEDEFARSVREELYDIIHRRGVDIIPVSSTFDPKAQKAVRVIDDSNIDNLQIAGVVRNGYTFAGKVIRPAEVVVARPKA